jgi:hypothetical protein
MIHVRFHDVMYSVLFFSASFSLFVQTLCIVHFMCCCMLYFGVGSWKVDKIYVPDNHVNDTTPHIILSPSEIAATEDIPFPVQGSYPIHRTLVYFRTLVYLNIIQSFAHLGSYVPSHLCPSWLQLSFSVICSLLYVATLNKVYGDKKVKLSV